MMRQSPKRGWVSAVVIFSMKAFWSSGWNRPERSRSARHHLDEIVPELRLVLPGTGEVGDRDRQRRDLASVMSR